jgi:hypothetical protein
MFGLYFYNAVFQDMLIHNYDETQVEKYTVTFNSKIT